MQAGSLGGGRVISSGACLHGEPKWDAGDFCGYTHLLCSVGPLEVVQPPIERWSLSVMGITEQGRYRYMDDFLQLQACAPVDWYVRWPRCPSPVNVGRLACHLHRHPDREFASYILRGFTEGFRVGFAYQRSRLSPFWATSPMPLWSFVLGGFFCEHCLLSWR